MSSSQSNPATKSASNKIQGKAPSLSIPFLIVVVALILSTARETASIHKQKMAFLMQNQKSAEALDISVKQTQALHKLQGDLQTLAASDPVAAKIVAEYFPPETAKGKN
jgi:hypothetical protein